MKFVPVVVAGALALAVAASPVLAQSKTVRGTVTAVAGDSVTVKTLDKDMTFKVDAKTDVIAKGGSTATRAAQAAGAAGPKLGDIIKVGEGIEVTYTEEAGVMHAKQIRGDVSVPSAAKPAAAAAPSGAKQKATGKVTAVAGDSVTVNSGGKDWIFKVDAKTDVIARGGSTATRAAQAAGAAGPKLGDIIKVGEEVEVEFHDMAGVNHATAIRVMKAM
jgi:hypothetical protein